MALTPIHERNHDDQYDDHMRLKRQRNRYKKDVDVLNEKLKDLHYHHDEQVETLWARIDQLERQIKTL